MRALLLAVVPLVALSGCATVEPRLQDLVATADDLPPGWRAFRIGADADPAGMVQGIASNPAHLRGPELGGLGWSGVEEAWVFYFTDGAHVAQSWSARHRTQAHARDEAARQCIDAGQLLLGSGRVAAGRGWDSDVAEEASRHAVERVASRSGWRNACPGVVAAALGQAHAVAVEQDARVPVPADRPAFATFWLDGARVVTLVPHAGGFDAALLDAQGLVAAEEEELRAGHRLGAGPHHLRLMSYRGEPTQAEFRLEAATPA